MTQDRPVVVLGECVADAFAEPPTADGPLGLEVHAGGGPANTAVALARLGTRTRFLGRLSDDAFGGLFRSRLAASGVDLDRCAPAAEPSTLAVAEPDASGQTRYFFYAESTADWQWTRAELRRGVEGDLDCLHTGSLALVREPGAAAVEELLAEIAPRATISLDPNVRPRLVDPGRYRDRLTSWCRYADILRVSDEDLAHLAPGAAPAAAADAWHALGVPLVVVTLGAQGAFASLRGQRVRVPSAAALVEDTVGAGDTFTAGLLHTLRTAGRLGGRLDGLTIAELRACLVAASRAAAATCAVRGANPPWAAAVAEPG